MSSTEGYLWWSTLRRLRSRAESSAVSKTWNHIYICFFSAFFFERKVKVSQVSGSCSSKPYERGRPLPPPLSKTKTRACVAPTSSPFPSRDGTQNCPAMCGPSAQRANQTRNQPQEPAKNFQGEFQRSPAFFRDGDAKYLQVVFSQRLADLSLSPLPCTHSPCPYLSHSLLEVTGSLCPVPLSLGVFLYHLKPTEARVARCLFSPSCRYVNFSVDQSLKIGLLLLLGVLIHNNFF